MIQFDQEEKDQGSVACIKVIGVGGAGGNTINRMIESGFTGAEFYAINTDAQALKLSLAETKIQIGVKSTKGLGAGANPEAGKRAAEEDLDKVMQELGNADIVFVTGGMGGGTGSGAIPVIVQALKDKGILTIAVVTKPFAFEGKRRARITEQAIEFIKASADTLIIIPNQKLLEVADETVSMIDGFGMINEVLNQSVRSISEIITRPGHINVDFADVREIMKDKGLAIMGTARASGQGRAKKAALEAISSPLLETMSIAGARAVLLNITGGTDLGLHEISEAASVIYEQADEDANIILGSVIDHNMGNEVLVTVIATGFSGAVQPVQPALQATAFVPSYTRPYVAPAKQVAASVQGAPQPVPAQVQQQVPALSVVSQVAPAAQAACVVAQEVPVAQHIESAPLEKAVPVIAQAAPQAVQEAPVMQVAPTPASIQQESGASPFAVRQEMMEKEQTCVLRQLSEEEQFEQLLKEEAQKAAAASALKPAEKLHQEEKHAASAEQPIHAQQEAAPASSHTIDINDLDVPAFMRKHAKEKRSE